MGACAILHCPLFVLLMMFVHLLASLRRLEYTGSVLQLLLQAQFRL